MSSSIVLTPFQRAILRRLAAGVSDYPSQELRQISQLTIFLVLETLEVPLSQIESILGDEVTQSLNAMVDAGADAALQRVVHTPACPCSPGGLRSLTVGGRHVPYFGVVAPDGQIAYTAEAQQWLQEHSRDRQA